MLGRRGILILTVMGTVPAFAVTQFAVGRSRNRREGFAAIWAASGARDLAQQRSAQAADDFRTAQAYASDPDVYRLPLAEALLAAGRTSEASAELLTALSAEPGSGRINVDLGRIAAAEGDVPGALRYYHAAVDGEWDDHPAQRRRDARMELARFLLAQNATEQAQIELTNLAADAPDDVGLLTTLGDLLMQTQAYPRALSVLDRVLHLDPRNARAARLAGEASFVLGDFRTARLRLQIAKARGGLDPAGEAMLEEAVDLLQSEASGS